MAFPSAAGYGNLPNGVFSPVVYSKQVLLSLKKRSIADVITNTQFEGEINQMGDTVRIIKQPLVSTVSYSRGQKLQSQDIIDSDIALVIDQALAYQFELNDIENAMAHVSWVDMCVDAAAYALRDGYDTNILTYILANVNSANVVPNASGVTTTPTAPATVGFGPGNDYTPLDLVSRMARLLNEANIPMEDRWFAATPAFFEALRREDSKFIEALVTGDPKSPIRDMRLAYSLQVHGFTMYESNNVPGGNGNSLAGASAGVIAILAGSKMATSTAASILKSEVVRSPDTFSDIYRGLYVFGRKVVRPTALTAAYVLIGDA
jgi:hypothetical protein